MKNRKMSTMVMAMALSTAMGITALASGESAGDVQDFTGNKANTEVKLLGLADVDNNLSATLPLNVTLAVKPSGEIVSPTAYKLTNTSQTLKVRVAEVQATMKGDYVTTDEAGKKNIGTITLGNDKGAAVKTLAEMMTAQDLTGDATNWTLESVDTAAGGGSDSMTLRFSGGMKFTDAAAAAEDAFQVTYTIAKVN